MTRKLLAAFVLTTSMGCLPTAFFRPSAPPQSHPSLVREFTRRPTAPHTDATMQPVPSGPPRTALPTPRPIEPDGSREAIPLLRYRPPGAIGDPILDNATLEWATAAFEIATVIWGLLLMDPLGTFVPAVPVW